MAEIVKAEIGAVSNATVEATKAGITAPLAAIVATADAASQSLREQRDALQAQIAPLQAQISTINAQIAAAEGPGAQFARNAIRMIDQALNPNAGRFPRLMR